MKQWSASRSTKKWAMTHKVVNKTWGRETWIVNTEDYCGKKMYVKDMWSSSGKYHYHMIKDETFYVLRGGLILDIMGIGRVILCAGESRRIKPNTPHRFRASSPYGCLFIEFSTHHEDSDSHYL